MVHLVYYGNRLENNILIKEMRVKKYLYGLIEKQQGINISIRFQLQTTIDSYFKYFVRYQ